MNLVMMLMTVLMMMLMTVLMMMLMMMRRYALNAEVAGKRNLTRGSVTIQNG